MKVNIGKNTLGDNDKLSVELKEYGRSTHDMSYAWRSPMGVGTLVPFMKILALPGDTFDIDLDTKVLTHPTVGPLFGQFKMQLDVFTCPLRLYQAQLHNNALNIGLDMKKVKLPKFAQNYKTKEGVSIQESKKSGKGSLAEYLGLRYEPLARTAVGNVNAIPYFAYYDVFKNYYANKQEEYFMVMGGGRIVTRGTITTENTTLYKSESGGTYINRKNAQGESAGLPVTFTITKELWETAKKDNTITLYYDEDSVTNISITINAILSYVEKEEEIEGNVKVTCRNRTKLVFADKEVLTGPHTLAGKKWDASQGVWVPNYTSSYKLEEIDNLREYILKQGKKEILIESTSKEEWLGTSFIKDVLVGTAGPGSNEPKEKMPIIQMEMGGLCLKTLQSDIFNNWVNKEWVDGDNGIKAITDVAITDGKLNLDSLNIAQKVYNMLNRIAVSGGSYKDWIETVYTTDYYFRAETPVYEGGMSTIIDFEAVVSNSASTASGVEEPLGSLAGRGYNGQKKGGKVEIKVNEPCYIMGIASITPLVDYSQGNDWDNWLETMDDLHKPQLDGIGYQDLMENKMHGLAKTTLAIGKQPAWLDYMTNFNKTYADFAAGEQESYMVLNRIYNVNDNGEIQNATTYINPKDYTYIFATNTETNRDFWVQIGCGVTARRVMSAAQIPLM
nr:MAG TPA: Major capsid protein [Microviridae sp.]